jgi:DNA polymerase-1
MKFVERTDATQIRQMSNKKGGPLRPHKVMVIGDCVNPIEEDLGVLWLGDYTKEFTEACSDQGVDCTDFYYTTAVKHGMFIKKAALPKTWINWSKELISTEISLVNPEIVVLLGAKALKAICGVKAKLSDYQGMSFTVDSDEYEGITFIACLNPSSLIHKPENRDQLRLDLSTLKRAMAKAETPDLKTSTITPEYHYILDLKSLQSWVNTIIDEYHGWLAVDCEWAGQTILDGCLRTIQIAWSPGKVIVPIFTDEDGNASELQQNLERAWTILRKLFEHERARLIGHFIRADLPWLYKYGVELGVNVTKGWDTGLAGHLLNENWKQALEVYTLRYTSLGRYDKDVKQWIKENKADVEENGFQHVPSEILLPYAAADADTTFRIFVQQYAEMRSEGHEDLLSLFENISMPATLPILEMELEGIGVDHERMIVLAKLYTEGKNKLKQALRDELNWPEFNPDSSDQKVEALFSVGKPNAQGVVTIKSPDDARLKVYTPVKRTGDGKKWVDVLSKGLLAESRPSTDKASIQTLLIENPDDPFLKNVLYYSAVSQAVKTFTGEYINADEGESVDMTKGILSKVWPDGRVHCRIRQTVETGRYGHSNPNMAQIPKSAEAVLSNVFEEEVPPIRSCFVPEPGWCFVDADWVGAELYVMAWLSGDTNMQERLSAPGVDFHSETALDMFQLEPMPNNWTEGTKAWIKHLDESPKRTIAKTITFGIAYGRGAAAIKEEVYRQGVNITVEESQEAIQKFKATYPQLTQWLGDQKALVVTQGFVTNALGRRRRFEKTNDHEVIAHQERQAMNMPIQGTVGDLMSKALVNLYDYRRVDKPTLNYKILMSVHDQILTTCPIEEVQETVQALQVCMCDRCTIPGYDLTLQIDPEISLRWGSPLTEKELEQHGIHIKE